MKKLLFGLLFSLIAYATGSVSIEPRYDFYSKDPFYIVALSVWEPITKTVAYNGWFGIGDDFEKNGPNQRLFQNWWVAKNQLDVKVKSLTVSPGVRVQYNDSADDSAVPTWLEEAFIRVSYKLW